MPRLIIGIGLCGLLVTPIGMATVGATASFATPAFEAVWQQSEVIAPNFWGPLETAEAGQEEPYAEAPGGRRLIQYFDKGRMELTNPATGIVTNGLLAADLIRGRIQMGDAVFRYEPPPAIPIAGDPDNAGPTYAGLASKGASLFVPTVAKPGSFVTLVAAADGTITNGGGFAGLSMSPPVSGYDATTQHNVLGVFADYRSRLGLLNIGYAIGEPFRADVKVAGHPVTVVVQVFERRVLTYTATNPDPFKVEAGNIGRHYDIWEDGCPWPPAAACS